MYSAKGNLYLISDVKKVTEDYLIRDFILEQVSENANYRHYVKFVLTNKRVNLPDRFQPGDTVEVLFHLKGKLSTSKYSAYNKLEAYAINLIQMKKP